MKENGFDNIHSLKLIDEKYLDQLELCINQHQQSIQNIIKVLNCIHSTIYSAQKTFKFLVGHRIVLLNWCKNLNKDKTSTLFNTGNPAFSPVMQEMIKSALGNVEKPANSRRFSNLLMDFSTYIYIMAGKASYEIISANLPLPKAKTICEFNLKIV